MPAGRSAADTDGIFLSYRHLGHAGFALALQMALSARLGAGRVFFDVHDVKSGERIDQAILLAIARCITMVVVIGPDWITASNARGRRLEQPDDYVRMEIELALARGLKVVVCLVDGADMPHENDLPKSLKGLAGLNAVKLDAGNLDAEVGRLVAEHDGRSSQREPKALSAVLVAEATPAPATAPIQAGRAIASGAVVADFLLSLPVVLAVTALGIALLEVHAWERLGIDDPWRALLSSGAASAMTCAALAASVAQRRPGWILGSGIVTTAALALLSLTVGWWLAETLNGGRDYVAAALPGGLAGCAISVAALLNWRWPHREGVPTAP